MVEKSIISHTIQRKDWCNVKELKKFHFLELLSMQSRAYSIPSLVGNIYEIWSMIKVATSER